MGVVQTKLAGCGQSRHLDRPWMTSLPQTELMVDSETGDELSPESSSLLSSSSDKIKNQLDAGKPCDGEPVSLSAAAVAASVASVAGDDGAVKDEENDVDDKINRVYTCARCYQEFHDEIRYQKHCNKCCDE